MAESIAMCFFKKREKVTRKKGDQQTDVRAICDMYKKKCRGIYMFFFFIKREREIEKKKKENTNQGSKTMRKVIKRDV